MDFNRAFASLLDDGSIVVAGIMVFRRAGNEKLWQNRCFSVQIGENNGQIVTYGSYSRD